MRTGVEDSVRISYVILFVCRVVSVNEGREVLGFFFLAIFDLILLAAVQMVDTDAQKEKHSQDDCENYGQMLEIFFLVTENHQCD